MFAQNHFPHPRNFHLDPAAVLGALERSVSQIDTGTYPPFNIVRNDDETFRLEFALAGFAREEIAITLEQDTLTIEGKPAEDAEERSYLHRGIARRGFRRAFRLADHIRVESADMNDGMLVVALRREIPEAQKPRKIDIAARH